MYVEIHILYAYRTHVNTSTHCVRIVYNIYYIVSEYNIPNLIFSLQGKQIIIIHKLRNITYTSSGLQIV